MVAVRDVSCIGPRPRHHLAVAAQHRILYLIEDLVPGVELDVVRIDVDDEIVVQVVAFNIALSVGENFPRIRVGGDLLGLVACGDESFFCRGHACPPACSPDVGAQRENHSARSNGVRP